MTSYQDYWKAKLSDKFRNERKHMDCLMKSAKRVKRSPSGHAISHNLPDLPQGGDEKSIEMHEGWMQQEVKKKKPQMTRITQLMDLTFQCRRTEVEEKILIQDLKKIYPALFNSFQIQQEFKRITGIQTEVMVNHITKMTNGILRQGYSSKELTHLINQVVTEDGQNNQEHKVTVALYCLPSLFKSPQREKIIRSEAEVWRNKGVDVAPLIVVTGDLLGETLYKIVSEESEILTTDNLLDAFGALMGCFYAFDMEYPQGVQDFYTFIEVVLLQMPNTKPTRQVRNVLAKLH